MRINQNIVAFNAYRNLTVTNGQLGKSLEKLSSGFRINRAADDAAGLVNSENLRSQIGGLKVATRNAQDAISLVQTAEGAQTEVHAILQRMRELSLHAANEGANDAAAAEADQLEIAALKEELTRIATQTQYGSKTILDGGRVTDVVAAGATSDFDPGAGTGGFGTSTLASFASVQAKVHAAYSGELGTGSAGDVTVDTLKNIKVTQTSGVDKETTLYDIFHNDAGGFTSAALAAGDRVAVPTGDQSFTFQVGANASQTVTVGIEGVSASALGLGTIDVSTVSGANSAISALDTAIASVSDNRAQLGAFQNRMESTIRNVSVAVENLSAAESRIRDADMAEEMVTFTRNQILQQAGTAMLAQANQVPQTVLSLLR